MRNQTQLFRILDLAAIALVLTSLFFLLTNGIPLAQWHWVNITFSKKLCVRWTRNVLVVVLSIFALWFWKWPRVFHRLAVVRWVKKVNEIPLRIVLLLLFIAYTASSTFVGFMRHWALETRAFDLGIFAQAVWNTLHGNVLYSSIKEGICLLGDHVSPILILTAPFYALWPDPKMLILIQAVAAALCIFPIGYLAKEKTRNSWIALIFALAYCFYLPTRNVLREDFHPEVLAEPFLLWAFIFLEKRRILLFLLSLLIIVSAKENMLGISFIFGLYAFIWRRLRMAGVIIMLFSTAIFLFDVFWLVPHFSNGLYFYRGNYTHLLPNPFLGVLRSVFEPEGLAYVLKIFSPFLFLPFFHFPTLLLTFPVLLQNLISRNPAMRSLGYHYTTGLTPFVFISTIYGFCMLCKKIRRLTRHQTVFVLIFLFVALLRSLPSEYFYFTEILSHKSPHRDMLRTKLKEIPTGVSVLTHNGLVPQLVNRKEIHQFSYFNVPKKVEFAHHYNADYVIFDREFWEPGTQPLEDSLKDLLRSGYHVEFQKDDFYILRRQTLHADTQRP